MWSGRRAGLDGRVRAAGAGGPRPPLRTPQPNRGYRSCRRGTEPSSSELPKSRFRSRDRRLLRTGLRSSGGREVACGGAREGWCTRAAWFLDCGERDLRHSRIGRAPVDSNDPGRRLEHGGTVGRRSWWSAVFVARPVRVLVGVASVHPMDWSMRTRCGAGRASAQCGRPPGVVAGRAPCGRTPRCRGSSPSPGDSRPRGRAVFRIRGRHSRAHAGLAGRPGGRASRSRGRTGAGGPVTTARRGCAE